MANLTRIEAVEVLSALVQKAKQQGYLHVIVRTEDARDILRLLTDVPQAGGRSSHDISPMQMREYLRGAHFRLAPDGCELGTPVFRREIKLRNDTEWRHLCRTDKSDDICTYEHLTADGKLAFGFPNPPPSSVEYVVKEAILGLRVYDDGTIAMIDAMTDG